MASSAKDTVNIDRLEAPNHMVPVDLAPSLVPDSDYVGRQYPLVSLLLPESPGSGVPDRLVFVARPYKLTHWAERDSDAPPTWMDPELFIRQLFAKSNVEKLAAKIAAGKDLSKLKQLEAILSKALDTFYIPYIQQQFKLAVPLLSRWLVARAATQLSDASRKKRKKRKTKKTDE